MRARALAGLVVLSLLAAPGCAGRGALPSSPRTGTPPSPTPTPRGSIETPRLWLAVFETAEDPNDLEESASELRDRAGTAVVVSPEGCYGGLRRHERITPGHYVLGVAAETRDGLEEAVERAGRDPLLTARVEDLCPI